MKRKLAEIIFIALIIILLLKTAWDDPITMFFVAIPAAGLFLFIKYMFFEKHKRPSYKSKKKDNSYSE